MSAAYHVLRHDAALASDDALVMMQVTLQRRCGDVHARTKQA